MSRIFALLLLSTALFLGSKPLHANTGRSLLLPTNEAVGNGTKSAETVQEFENGILELMAAKGTAFPEGTLLQEVLINEHNIVEIIADYPESFLDAIRSGSRSTDQISGEVWDRFFDAPVKGFNFLALDSATGRYIPLSEFEGAPVFDAADFAPDTAIPPKIDASEKTMGQFPRPVPGGATGALTNRVVHLNAGHGWTYRSSGFWGVQRTFFHNNIEDMSNADLIHQYVVAYLLNAGAEVFTVREMDPNPNMVIVDNDDGAPNYVEAGPGWSTSSLAGFQNGRIPYTRTNTVSQAENPFTFGSIRLVQCVTGNPTSTAAYIPTIPEAGYYNVYVSHGAFTNRSPQAHYRVNHAGGYTDRYIDQRRYRSTWIFVGRYYFEAGRDAAQASVMLTNTSASTAHYVSTDAVRFGGGRGLINRSGIGTSGYARYDEEAVYHMQFMGAPASTVHQRVADNDEEAGWSGRPRFAGWLKTLADAYGAPAQQHVAMASHTNATTEHTGRGLITYLHSSLDNTTVHYRFREAVHNQVMHNINQAYPTGFVANGNPKRSASLGEASATNSGGIPIFLGEWIFHDHASDMALYHDPKFRRIMARGIYQGIVKFYQSEYGGNGTLLPEPPRELRARATDSTSVQLQWTAPLFGPAGGRGDAATGYKIYRSTHGRGFPPGTSVGNVTQSTVSGLLPDTTYYLYVTATNAGGESFATETLAVHTPKAGQDPPRLLLVNGFDKMDIATRVHTSVGANTVYRHFMDQMNGFDHIVEHARAIDAWDGEVVFDSVSRTAVDALLVDLAPYDAVIWMGGLQAEVSTTDPVDDTTLKPNSRNALAAYLTGGGNLFVSGASVAKDLNRISQTSFMNNNLKIGYSSTSPGSNAAFGLGNTIFAGLPATAFGRYPNSRYDVREPDVIAVSQGSVRALEYTTAPGAVMVHTFDAADGFQQPSFSGQTNADPSSSFAIASSPVRSGSGSGRLNYVWGSGNFIRLYNSSLPAFPANSDFSVWIYGDNSGHNVRVCLRDSDNDLFVSAWKPLSFSGWQILEWPNLSTEPQELWAGSGNGAVDGPNMRLDSIQVQKVSAVNSGSMYFDEAAYFVHSTPTSGPAAGVQFSGNHKVVYMAFPFESIEEAESRDDVMGRILNFFDLDPAETDKANAWMIF